LITSIGFEEFRFIQGGLYHPAPKNSTRNVCPRCGEKLCCIPENLVLYIRGIFEESAMFGIGMPELLLILGLALVILGPKKLPGLAKGLGRAIREFKSATNDMRESLREETHELEQIKDRFVDEIDRATEPEEVAEEAAESEEDTERAVEESGAGEATQDTEKTDEVNHADGGKPSTEEPGKSPPG
jgi:TatA/E family protein of Tat protein translocase